MSGIVFGLRRMSLRRIITACLVGLIVFVSTAVGSFSFIQPAQAAPTQQATDYQANQSNGDEASGGLVESIKNTAETVKEKLNLDQPLPQSTKTFIKQVQGEDVEAEEPIPFGKGQQPQNE